MGPLGTMGAMFPIDPLEPWTQMFHKARYHRIPGDVIFLKSLPKLIALFEFPLEIESCSSETWFPRIFKKSRISARNMFWTNLDFDPAFTKERSKSHPDHTQNGMSITSAFRIHFQLFWDQVAICHPSFGHQNLPKMTSRTSKSRFDQLNLEQNCPKKKMLTSKVARNSKKYTTMDLDLF